jgi:alkaline phosphatase
MRAGAEQADELRDATAVDRCQSCFIRDIAITLCLQLCGQIAAISPAFGVADRASTQPSLSDMTSKAIDVLSKNDNGYFLMVEGGRIDHALHGTNAKRALEDTVAFDNAIKTALAKVDLTNTLIVVTADHDHTMTINGYSAKGNPILGLVTDKDGNQATDVNGRPYTTLVFGNGSNRPLRRKYQRRRRSSLPDAC